MTLTERCRQYRHVHVQGPAHPHAHKHSWPTSPLAMGRSGAFKVDSIKGLACLIASRVGPEPPGEELQVPSPPPTTRTSAPGPHAPPG